MVGGCGRSVLIIVWCAVGDFGYQSHLGSSDIFVLHIGEGLAVVPPATDSVCGGGVCLMV